MYEIGEYIDLKQHQKSVVSKKEQNGYGDQYFTKEDIQFRVLYKDEERKKLVCIADKPTEQELYLEGKEGYKNGIAELHRICKEISGYENARSMTIEDIENSKYWEEQDKKKTNMIFGKDDNFYSWLASTCVYLTSYNVSFKLFYLNSVSVDAVTMYNSDNYYNIVNYALRPVVEIEY